MTTDDSSLRDILFQEDGGHLLYLHERQRLKKKSWAWLRSRIIVKVGSETPVSHSPPMPPHPDAARWRAAAASTRVLRLWVRSFEMTLRTTGCREISCAHRSQPCLCRHVGELLLPLLSCRRVQNELFFKQSVIWMIPDGSWLFFKRCLNSQIRSLCSLPTGPRSPRWTFNAVGEFVLNWKNHRPLIVPRGRHFIT